MKIPKCDIVSTTLLIAGTCIGGGMLALPLSTGLVGFIPSTLMMFLCWIFMTTVGLLVLEANLWMKEEDAHVITMTSRLLGPIGKWLMWLVYLFVGYASLVAYTSAGGGLASLVVKSFWDIALNKFESCLLFVGIFGLLIYFGHHLVGRINTILFSGMILAYFALVAFGINEVEPDFVLRSTWSIPLSLISISMFLTSFSYQYLVPSLAPMLKRHRNALRFTIIAGTTIALIIYLAWQWIVLGLIPFEGENGLLWAYENDAPVTIALRNVVNNTWITTIADFFTFFALATSFIGIALGLFDFLSDGLKIKAKGRGKILLSLLIIIPTLYFAANYSRIFILALSTSGGFGDGLFNALIVLMVWKGRYHKKLPYQPCLPGGKPALIAIFLFSLLSICEMARELIF